MAFPFGRQTSRDALEETRRSIKSSLTEGSSKIFGSVMGAKRGLIGGITSTFDQVVNIVGGGGGGGVDGGETAVAGAEDGSGGGGGGAGPPKPRPPKPPAPRQRPGGAVVVDSNGTVSRQQAPGPSKGNPDKDGPASASASGTDFADGKQRRKIDVKHPLKRRNTNPFMDDYDPSAVEPDYAPSDPPGVKDADDEVAHRDVIKVNVAGAAAQKRHSEAWISRAGSGGQDLSSSLQQRRRASEAAAAYSGGMHVPDHSDADSEGTEGCDEEEEEEEEEEEKEDRLLTEAAAGDGSDPIRSMQCGRRSSGGGGGGDEVEADPVSEFMEYFVRKIFNRSQEITSTDKAKFGELCQNGFGRLWFAKCINSQCTNDRSSVSEETFYALVQFFVVVLFECNEAEDYEPAMTLMNTCFTFHCKAGVGSKQFLYSFVKDQPIWQSPRFWSAALFYAVQQERASTPLRNEKKEEEKQDNQEDITYEQLRSFAANMRALGLSKEQCLEFIRKQAATTNVSPGLQNQLRQGMERWTEDAALH